MCLNENVIGVTSIYPWVGMKMEEKYLSPADLTLSEMGARAKQSRCNCTICIQLRQMVFAELENRIRAQRSTINMLQNAKPSETASTDLATKDAPNHAEDKTSKSHKGAS